LLVPLARRRSEADLHDGGGADLGGHLRDALERGHRRAALLEELPRLHDVQARLRDPRGPSSGGRDHDAPLHHSGGADPRPASMVGGAREGACADLDPDIGPSFFFPARVYLLAGVHPASSRAGRGPAGWMRESDRGRGRHLVLRCVVMTGLTSAAFAQTTPYTPYASYLQHGPVVEVQPFLGYRFGGSFDIDDPRVSGFD